MEHLIVTERDLNCQYIAYIAAAMANRSGAEIGFFDGRVRLSICMSASEGASARRILEGKIAEVLCIGYKYSALQRWIHPAGLNEEDREILIAAIISADFMEDKRYVLTRLQEQEEYTIDGIFHFRLHELQEKWKGVAACVPSVFTRGQLIDFMEFLLGTGRGKVFLKGEEVYDSRCRRLRRSSLIEGGRSEMNTIREIVLSGACKVECLSLPSARQEHFLRRYYAGRVGFLS